MGRKARLGRTMAEADKAARRSSKRLRCAIYTRKSTDEGLEQAFNSLDAQREACAAFVLSQKHEDWTVLPTLYDDGGYSGGTIERPALKRLIADIEAGQIDVVVVYKVDRLTRALSDFAKLVEIFDRRSVSFVSITQQFNTTTSMGRLTLNVLLSFAQFEHEVIGERVRDKIAASKRKGMWMGGSVPLGYDVKDRKLVINRAEARSVVDIFERYLRVRSVRALAEELCTAGIRSKRRVHADGTAYGNQRFSHGALYLLLQNRTYRGEATHKGNSYPGQHAAIVDKKLWDAVQAALGENRIARATGARTKHPSLLTGILFDEAGGRLTPTHCVKKGTRYRYYVSTALVTPTGSSSRRRIPAGNLETVVVDRLRTFLANRVAILDAIGDEAKGATSKRHLFDRASQIAAELEIQEPEKTKGRNSDLGPPRGDQTRLRQNRYQSRPLGRSAHRAINQSADAGRRADGLTRRHPESDGRGKTDAHRSRNEDGGRGQQRSSSGSKLTGDHRPREDKRLSVHDVARQERVTAAYIYTLLRLPWLAPDITTAIVNGQQPPQLNAKKLKRLTARLPGDWSKQRALLGFR
jgi:site-specific DNA recombinase